MRTTIYIDDGLLLQFDDHIGLVKRSTAIAQLIKQELKTKGRGTIG